MQHTINLNTQENIIDNGPDDLHYLCSAMNSYLIQKEVNEYCYVQVLKQDKWFELQGVVDSQWTRSVLFAMVPKDRGARYIIDKLTIFTPIQNEVGAA